MAGLSWAVYLPEGGSDKDGGGVRSENHTARLLHQRVYYSLLQT